MSILLSISVILPLFTMSVSASKLVLCALCRTVDTLPRKYYFPTVVNCICFCEAALRDSLIANPSGWHRRRRAGTLDRQYLIQHSPEPPFKPQPLQPNPRRHILTCSLGSRLLGNCHWIALQLFAFQLQYSNSSWL